MFQNGGLSFGYGYTQRGISKEYPYFLQPFDAEEYTPPYAVPFDPVTGYPLPLTLTEVKEFLRIDPDMTADDTLITSMMAAAVAAGEKYTKRDFIIKSYLTYRDYFYETLFTLRKSPFYILQEFKYMVDDVFIDVPDVYYTTHQQNYSAINLKVKDSWPNNIQERLQAIKIIFQAGYGFYRDDVPEPLRLAMLNHIGQMYANRGDCSGDDAASGDCGSLPAQSKYLYNLYRIHDLYTNPYN